MSKLKYFKSDFVDQLRELEDLSFYSNDDELRIDESAIVESRQTDIAEQIPRLNPAIDSDAENAMKIYAYLPLNPTQASDTRLWTYMAHVTFRGYTKNRWSLKESSTDSQKRSYIEDHWFSSGSSRSLRRNSISRLWWAAHLTVAPWEKDSYFASLKNMDRYVYTKILLSSQDVAQQLLERRLSWSNKMLVALLEYFRSDDVFLHNRALCRNFLKEINLVLGYRKLMTLDLQQLLVEIRGIGSDIKSDMLSER